MSARFASGFLRRTVWFVMILSVLVLAVLYFVPPRTEVLSAGLVQRRGALRERLRDRLQERAAEAKETRQRNERPPDETRQIAGLTVAIWKPSQRFGRAPLLVFSHGLNGCNNQSTYFMQRFADEGYLVVAPNHKDASCGTRRLSRPEEKLARPGTWTENSYRDRGNDIKNLLAALRRDSLNSQIDWSRLGLVGHSLGGYTVLGVAGGWPGWKLSGVNIKAVLAWSPYCEPFAINGSLDRLRVPVMYQGGTRDIGITPSVRKSGGCFDKTASPAIYVEFTGAGHIAWSDFQDSALELIEAYSLEFLDKYVRGIAGADPTERAPGVSNLKVK